MNRIISIVLVLFCTQLLNAQKVRLPYKVDNSATPFETGAIKVFTYGHHYGDVVFFKGDAIDDISSESKKGKPLGILKYHFMPFNATQLMIAENYNPGAIVKIEIGSKSKRQVVYTAESEVLPKKYRVTNLFFDKIEDATQVWIYVDYKTIKGSNQIAGIALSNSKDSIKAEINLPITEPFEGEAMNMNDDVSGDINPTSMVISVDGSSIYFNYSKNNHEILEKGEIGEDGKFKKVSESMFNVPIFLTSSSGLVSVSQDENIMFIDPMDIDFKFIYKVYQKKNRKGVLQWSFDKVKVTGATGEGTIRNEFISYDGQFFIVTKWEAKKGLKPFGLDLYVAKRNKNGSFSNFIRMGDDINTLRNQYVSFLAADNKTLFFASDGHAGYGKKDLFVTRRLDDTWQNWSRPVNLGPKINTFEDETFLTVDSKGHYVYFTQKNANYSSDIFRINIAQPKIEEKREVTIKPEAVVVIKGIVLDADTKTPLQAIIKYKNLITGEEVGEAISNANDGSYSIVLPAGTNYSYEAISKNYISESEHINADSLQKTKIINKNLLLIPIKEGQTVTLNNLFFKTGKADLEETSNQELKKLLKIMADNGKMQIEISGHTDNIGKKDSNLKLSKARAQSVVDWLTSNSVDSSRIIAKGYGESSPISTNDTKEGRAINRRVSFTILGN